MSFGKNLQMLRKKNQLSQEGLAEMLGVSRQAVSKWELGEGYPEVDKLLILSEKLNVSLDSLLGVENMPGGENTPGGDNTPGGENTPGGDNTPGGENMPGRENTAVISENGRLSDMIRIISPNEGVIINASKVIRSQQFKGGKNSPKYALYASDGKDTSFWGAQNTFLAWYRNLDDVTREIAEIQNALNAGAASYTLKYSVKCKQNLLRTIEE